MGLVASGWHGVMGLIKSEGSTSYVTWWMDCLSYHKSCMPPQKVRKTVFLAKKLHTFSPVTSPDQKGYLRPVLSRKKTGMNFRYDFVAGGQIVPQK